MVLYKNTKVKACLPDGDIDFFDIVASVLQGDTFTLYLHYLPRLYTSNIDRSNERYLKKKKREEADDRYPAQTITDTYYADGLALLANTPTQADSLVLSLEQAAGGIGLCLNTDQTEFMCFNQKGDISTLNGGSLKSVNKFMHLRRSISSTENDINMQLAKAWTAIDSLSIIWKSNLSDEIKRNFFQAVIVSILLYRCTIWTLTSCIEKKLDGNRTRMLCHIKQMLEATSHKTVVVRPLISHL